MNTSRSVSVFGALAFGCAIGCTSPSDRVAAEPKAELLEEQSTPTVLPVSFERIVPGLGSVIDVQVSEMDSSRRIWLLTNSAKPITLLDERTDSVLQIGRRGQGPGDTRFAWIFASTSSNPSEAPDLFDIGGRKVVHYTVDGRATENVLRFLGPSSVMDSFRESSYGLPRRMMAMRSGWIWNEFSGFVSSGKDLWPLSLLRADFSGHVDTIYHRTAPVELTLKPEQQFFIPVPLVSRCNDSLFVVYLNEPDTLFWLDDSGRQLEGLSRV